MDRVHVNRSMENAMRSGRSLFTSKLNFQKLGRERECLSVFFFFFFFIFLLHFLSLYNLCTFFLFPSLKLRLLAETRLDPTRSQFRSLFEEELRNPRVDCRIANLSWFSE
ncbi:hypothetical protein RJT34_29470 [Clitoria ternatea]|uniref:Uncharacterized protein n=1 Tax=Clitoria ternatea TaxID=43366 RepID=A0AAN9FA04_CLITE